MFGTFLTFVLGGIVAGDEIRKGQVTQDNRSTAINSGKRFYYDGNNKQRSTETNEICIMVNEDGFLRMVGVNTGRVYQDITMEKTQKENEQLRSLGKKFHYEYFHQWSINGKVCKLPVENATGRPFDIGWVKGGYYMSYYNMNSKITPSTEFGSSRSLSSEEAQYYMP